MFVDNQKQIFRNIVLDLIVDDQVFIFGVVKLDLGLNLGLVTHINSGSYREEAETPETKRTTFNMASCNAQTSMMK